MIGNGSDVQGSSHSHVLGSIESLSSLWFKRTSPLKWDCLFVTPPWLEVWWREFGSKAQLLIYAVEKGGAIIGVAPLLLEGGEASIVGSEDVCDFVDFVVAPGQERDFFNTFIDDMIQRAVKRLRLRLLRPDSAALGHLEDIAKGRGYQVSCQVEDVTVEMDLPATWEQYLGNLNRKQRHEVRRKLRRLAEAGDVNYRVIDQRGALSDAIALFLRLFRMARTDKDQFLTPKREAFFRSLAKGMAQAQLLRIGILELDAKPVASLMCFDYNDTMYLYNSGYDPEYSHLSVGLVSKILCIKETIERGKTKFDFLKGAEVYKYRLGGKEVPLRGCEILFS